MYFIIYYRGEIKMKKWEKPEINKLEIKETQVTEFSCQTCTGINSKLGAIPFVSEVTCYQCDCCKKHFHIDQFNGSAEDAKAAAQACEDGHNGVGCVS